MVGNIQTATKSGADAGFSPDQLKVGLHSFGYVANTREEAMANFYPSYEKTINKVGKERGWPPVTRSQFDAQTDELGAIVIGNPEEVAERIHRHSETLGGISSFNFQMDVGLSQEQMKASIALIGQKVLPIIKT